MAEQDNLRALKTVVISLGVLLLLGSALLIGLVVHKLGSRGAGTQLAVEDCEANEIDLRGRGELMDTTLEGGTVRMMFADDDDDADRTTVVTLDSCSGEVLSDLTVLSDAPSDDWCADDWFSTPQL